jgi:hypothetical protein
MNSDKKLIKWLAILLLLPLVLAYFSNGGESFRYPCQNPENWDKPMCQLPACDVTRTCPQHIFKGQRDPRLGPEPDGQTQKSNTPTPTTSVGSNAQGANCGK